MSLTPGAREGGHYSQVRPNPVTEGNKTGRSILSRVGSTLAQVFVPRADWLGPQMPIAPQAPDNVAGRQWDYPPGYNILIEPRQAEEFSFTQLRMLAQYDVIAGLIQRRIDQIRDLDWQIRGKSTIGSQTPISRDDERVKEVQKFLERPAPGVYWSDFISMFLKDVLEIDAGCIYIRRTKNGELYSLDNMDGSLITPKIGSDGRMPLPPLPAYQQVLHGLPAVDYSLDEMIYRPRNVSSSKVYGCSPVEQIALTINMCLRRGISQLNYFSEGTISDGYITGPEGWTQSQLETLQSWFDATLSGNLARRRKLTVVPFGAKFETWKQPALKDDFDEWLARISCFAFAYPPTVFTKSNNRATADISQEVGIDEGREPLKKWLKEFMDQIIHRAHGYDDIEFGWIDKRTVKPEDQQKMDAGDVNAGLRTRNEVRVQRGLDPAEGGDVLTVTTGQGIFPVTYVASGALAAAQEAGNPVSPSAPDQKGSPLGGGAPAAKPQPKSTAVEKMLGVGENKTLRTLVITRPLLNVEEFHAWAKEAGFETAVPDPHVTLIHSRAPVDWTAAAKPSKHLIVRNGARSMQKFGNAAVLEFDSNSLLERWKDLTRVHGASHQFGEYRSHVTASWASPPDLDISLMKPFDGDLVFGPEELSEIDDAWEPPDEKNLG